MRSKAGRRPGLNQPIMLPKSNSFHTVLRSIQTGSLLLAAAAGLSLNAQAGEEYSRTSNKDKNVIQQAQPKEPKFYLTLSGLAEWDYNAARFVTDGNAVFNGTAYNPAVAGNQYAAHIHSANFTSTHDPVIGARTDIGYQVLPWLSVFGGFTYSHANGHERRVGYVVDDGSVPNIAAGRYDLWASLGDYQSYAGRGGVKINTPRYLLDLLHLPKAISPYASLSIGGKYLESQEVSFFSGTRSRFVDTAYGTMYGNSWVLTAEGALGYELKLTRNLSVVLESTYGYDTAPKRGQINGVTGTNDGGDRFYSGVTLGGKVRF